MRIFSKLICHKKRNICCEKGHQCKRAVCFFSINAFQLDKGSAKVLLAQGDTKKERKKTLALLLPSKATSPFSVPSWNEYCNGAAIWLVNKQQPSILCSTRTRSQFLSWRNINAAAWLQPEWSSLSSSGFGLTLLCSNSCSRLLFLLCTRQVLLLLLPASLLGAGGRVSPSLSVCFAKSSQKLQTAVVLGDAHAKQTDLTSKTGGSTSIFRQKKKKTNK